MENQADQMSNPAHLATLLFQISAGAAPEKFGVAFCYRPPLLAWLGRCNPTVNAGRGHFGKVEKHPATWFILAMAESSLNEGKARECPARALTLR